MGLADYITQDIVILLQSTKTELSNPLSCAKIYLLLTQISVNTKETEYWGIINQFAS